VCAVVDGRQLRNDSPGDVTAAAAAAAAEGSTSSLSLCTPIYSRLNHQVPVAASPLNRFHHQQQPQPQPADYIPRSHESQRHPYWAVESIRQALSTSGAGRCQSSSSHSQQLDTPSLQSDTAAAAAGVVVNGNSEMRDQATNTDIASECKSFSSIS